jgi:SAM-dependent methyltransferase
MGTSFKPTTQTMIRRVLGRASRYLHDSFGIHLSISGERPEWPRGHSRFSYQKQYIEFDIKPGERVLDVGNGGDPFPYATVLVDRFLELNPTRHEPLVTKNKPFTLADIHHLPFRDKSFDYIYCVHVLEVIENPLKACQELIRVGKRGFIETPTAGKDMLFAWARGEQKWHLVAIGRTLCFFEYSDRQLDGIRSHAWRDLVFSSRRNPIQEAFQSNQDIFNVMFTWQDSFAVCVFWQDGTIQTLNTDVNNLPQLALASGT